MHFVKNNSIINYYLNNLKKILIILWKIWFIFINIFLIILWGVGSIPFLFNKKSYSIAYWFHRMWGKSNLFLMGFRCKIEFFKEKKLKNQPYIIIANHTSIIDIMIIYSLFKYPLVFIGKSELVKIPIFGYIYKKSNIILDRNNKLSYIKVLKEAESKIDSGKSICIFPEGGVPHSSFFLAPFKNGAFYIAINKQIPILVITIEGMKKFFPYKLTLGFPGKIFIKQHSIIPTNGLTKNDIIKLKNKCYQMIYSQLKKFEKKRNIK